MLDLHASSITGAAAYTDVSTILAGGDGASTVGTPVADNANLVGWGGLTTIASPILAIRLKSQDLLDTANNLEEITTAGVEGIKHFWDNMSSKAQRLISMKTGAVNTMAYQIDNYPGGNVMSIRKYGKSNQNGWYSQTFSGALTAITWGTQAFNPAGAGGSTGASNPPPGKYAILGAKVHGLTNYAVLRFQHANFGGLFPGFPVLDHSKAVARAVVSLDDIFQSDGYQFAAMSDILGIPCCPTFNITAQGTGLTLWAGDITADTPIVNLNLVKVG